MLTILIKVNRNLYAFGLGHKYAVKFKNLFQSDIVCAPRYENELLLTKFLTFSKLQLLNSENTKKKSFTQKMPNTDAVCTTGTVGLHVKSTSPTPSTHTHFCYFQLEIQNMHTHGLPLSFSMRFGAALTFIIPMQIQLVEIIVTWTQRAADKNKNE